jgi:hypothetical protein
MWSWKQRKSRFCGLFPFQLHIMWDKVRDKVSAPEESHSRSEPVALERPAVRPSPKPKGWGRNGESLRIVTEAKEANEEPGRLSFPASRSALAGSIRREPDANPMITR